MKQFLYTVKDPEGIHARPAGMLVKKAKEYESSVTIVKGDATANAKQIFTIMGMAVKNGEEVTFVIEGTDEDAAFAGIEEFVKGNL